MSDYKFLLDFVGESLNIPQSELSSLIKEDNPAETLTALKERDKARVATLTESVTKKQQEYVNKGYSDAMRKVKGYVKTKYNTDFDADNVEEVIDHVYSDVSTKASKSGELDEEKIKLHPIFQAKEREFQKQLKAKDEEFNQKWTAKEAAEKRAKTIGEVSKDAFGLIDEMKPTPRSKPILNQRDRENFQKEVLESYDWERNAANEWVPFKEGKRVENEHGYPVPFSQLVKEKSNDYFEFPVNNGGKQPGNGKEQRTNVTTTGKAPRFENEAQYTAFIQSKDPNVTVEDKKAAMASWDAQKAQPVQ